MARGPTAAISYVQGTLRTSQASIRPHAGYQLFFCSEDSQQALNTLLIAAKNGEGFICITGEVGTGKTLLCRKFMASLDQSFVTAFIQNPALQPRSLMLALADELEIENEKYVDQHKLLKSIYYRLVALAREHKKVLLCIDEAQAMPLETMEAVRLLTNLETEKRKLMQIVMFGQPELSRKLDEQSIRQLKQRITFHYHLGPLGLDDLEAYIDHRLAVAGHEGEPLFTRGAIRALHRASGGIPRLANILAHKSLMASFGEGRSEVNAKHVRAAAKDTLGSRRSRFLWWPLAAFTLSIAGLGIAWAILK